MKKTFRSILAGALALLTVSCYDDSALREQINGLDERVTAIENTLNKDVDGINDLASRLADAEDALAAANASLTSAQGSITEILAALDAFDGQVDGLVSQFEKAIEDLGKADSDLAKAISDGDNALAAALLEGKTELAQQLAAVVAKVAVVKVEEVGGNVVLTLADESTVTLSKPLSNVDNSGLVTVDEKGNWAVVKADGTLESLNVPVGHPDVKIQFQVADNGDLQYAVNGGEWTATGVNTADVSGQAYVINGVEVADDNSNVAITIGETVYNLPLYVAKTVVFELSRESMYVGYGFSKTFTIEAEGVEDFYVAAKPDGWKVSVEGNVVTVVAPSQALVELGASESEGEIVLHADAEGCKYASLEVVAGPAFSIEIDSKTGDVTLFNALATEYPDLTGLYGPTYEFANAQIGILMLSDFESMQIEELIALAEEGYLPSGYLESLKFNLDIDTYYQTGVYEEDKFSVNISELGSKFYPRVEIEEGVSYVVWALPQTDKVLKDQFTYAFYKPLKVQPEAKTVSFNDITINLAASGATGFYGTLVQADMLMPDEGLTLEYFLMNGYGMGGPWMYFQQSGDPQEFGAEIVPGEDFNLSLLNYDEPLNPNTLYYLVVFPYDHSKSVEEYDLAADVLPYVFEFTTTGLVAGDVEAEFTYNEEMSDYKTIAVDVVVPEGCTTYYSFQNPGAMDDMTDEELAGYLLQYSPYGVQGEETVMAEYLTPALNQLSVSKELVAVTVTADGKYAISRGVYTTREIPVDDSITMTVDTITKDADNNVTAVFNVTGATKVAVYPYYNANQPAAFRLNVLSKGVTGNSSGVTFGDVVDGKVTVTFNSSNDNLFFIGYNVADGAVSGIMPTGYAKVSDYVTK